jgi:ATP-dependent DNA helicase RecG
MSNDSFRSDPYRMPVQYLKGIGPRKGEALQAYGIETVHDLLMHIPRRYIDRTTTVPIGSLRNRLSAPATAVGGIVREQVTVLGTVRSFRLMGMGKRARFVLVLADETGSVQCVWFGGVHFWQKMFRVGEMLAVSGEPGQFGQIVQFVHPEFDRITAPAAEEEDAEAPRWADLLNTGGMVPLYPSGKDLERIGLDSGGFRRIISSALRQSAGLLEEMMPRSLLAARALVSESDALRAVHFPPDKDTLAAGVYRLKYQELFLFQLMLALKRRHRKNAGNGIAFDTAAPVARRLVDSLPFVLTPAQKRVVREILGDMENPKPMNRLLQGDVGSGKTVVALIAMLVAVHSGYQAVLMAPTELLAEQHFGTLQRLLNGLPVNVRLLTGAQKSKTRRDVLEDLRSGGAQIVVGTHALFESDVAFAKLGLVVIDEQHRFGVRQRASLRAKGATPDVLVMTATPIPRTLSLTLFGDLDVSVIDELPGNRKPIRTVVKGEGEMPSIASFVRDEIQAGRQAYFVYPLIEESEKLDLKAATEHFVHLRETWFPGLRVELVHGRIPREERDALMRRFRDRDVDILVATTVIEVGIDVPNASVMVIENAERFGLAQLHQLRGRVGRGADQSTCILVTKDWKAKAALRASAKDDDGARDRARLATMVETTDGFRIAEVDLRLRGPGDFFGTRQSGVPAFRVADIVADAQILQVARDDAFALVERDAMLAEPDDLPLARHLRSHESDALHLLTVA